MKVAFAALLAVHGTYGHARAVRCRLLDGPDHSPSSRGRESYSLREEDALGSS